MAVVVLVSAHIENMTSSGSEAVQISETLFFYNVGRTHNLQVFNFYHLVPFSPPLSALQTLKKPINFYASVLAGGVMCSVVRPCVHVYVSELSKAFFTTLYISVSRHTHTFNALFARLPR